MVHHHHRIAQFYISWKSKHVTKVKATNILNVPQLNVSPLKQKERFISRNSSCGYRGWQGGLASVDLGKEWCWSSHLKTVRLEEVLLVSWRRHSFHSVQIFNWLDKGTHAMECNLFYPDSSVLVFISFKSTLQETSRMMFGHIWFHGPVKLDTRSPITSSD